MSRGPGFALFTSPRHFDTCQLAFEVSKHPPYSVGHETTPDSSFRKRSARFATNYRDNHAGQLVPVDTGNDTAQNTHRSQPTMPSGAGGLVSTAEDYYRFAQMLANGGELDGKRILAPATIKLMTSNHLSARLLSGEFGIGQHVMRPGFGYGFNCAVVFDPAEAALPDGKGTFFWDGAAGTWFWVDPTNDIVFVSMIQRMTSPDNHSLEWEEERSPPRVS